MSCRNETGAHPRATEQAPTGSAVYDDDIPKPSRTLRPSQTSSSNQGRHLPADHEPKEIRALVRRELCSAWPISRVRIVHSGSFHLDVQLGYFPPGPRLLRRPKEVKRKYS